MTWFLELQALSAQFMGNGGGGDKHSSFIKFLSTVQRGTKSDKPSTF